MDSLAHAFAWMTMVLFVLGWIGCAITIPLCAIKFVSVLFQKDQEEMHGWDEAEASSELSHTGD